MIDIKQALRILTRLREAAPPATAARLADVIALVEAFEQNTPAYGMKPVSSPASPIPVSPAQADTTLIERAAPHVLNAFQHITDQVTAIRAGRLGRLTSEQLDGLKLVLDHAHSGAQFMEKVAELQRLSLGQFTANRGRFNPLDAAAEVWQRTSAFAESRDHEFTILADNPMPAAYGDYDWVVTIMAALVDNAVRYMPVGGEIRLTINNLGAHVLFNVADSGIGFTGEDQKQVGQPFWRALHQPLVRAYSGTGLSLAIAKSVLAHMDSELIFSGEANVGSTFSFTMPVAPT